MELSVASVVAPICRIPRTLRFAGETRHGAIRMIRENV
jgi:hypothetical protein